MSSIFSIKCWLYLQHSSFLVFNCYVFILLLFLFYGRQMMWQEMSWVGQEMKYKSLKLDFSISWYFYITLKLFCNHYVCISICYIQSHPKCVTVYTPCYTVGNWYDRASKNSCILIFVIWHFQSGNSGFAFTITADFCQPIQQNHS